MSICKCVLSILLALVLSQSASTLSVAEPVIEPFLAPGKVVPTVRAITCNTAKQLASILDAYSRSYQAGRAVFERHQNIRSFDAAAEQMAPVCDEVWFTAIIPVRTISNEPYKVWFADGSVHKRYVIEAKPVGPSGVPSSVSYFISSRWKVLSVETAL